MCAPLARRSGLGQVTGTGSGSAAGSKRVESAFCLARVTRPWKTANAMRAPSKLTAGSIAEQASSSGRLPQS